MGQKVASMLLVGMTGLLAACGSSSHPGPREEEQLILDTDPKPVPLIKAVDPPAQLPTVKLLRWSGRRAEVVQEGIRYAGEWIVDGKLERAGEPLPMPWPKTVEADGRLFVSFGAVTEPEFIEVRVFGEKTDANGMPTDEEPMRTVECALTDPNTPHCIERRPEGVGVEVMVPAGGVRHVTAWASWDVPLSMRQRLGLDTGDVYAAWLFRVRA